MSSTLARHVDRASLPVIDISGLASSEVAERKQVARALRAACIDKGFFYCTGHGIPEGLMEAVLAETRALFAQSPDEKLDLEKSKRSKANRGYEILGGQTLQADAPPDRKEGYYIGLELHESHPHVLAGRFNRGPNVWPHNLPGFRPTMLAYYAGMQALGERLMQGLALSLDLAEDHFDGYGIEPLSTLRLLHYPPQRPDAPNNELGAGAHSDWGAITLLMQDDVGGLQVYDNKDQSWIHAEPVAGAFVVNLGDAMARWTNDLYKSTLHRVVNTSGRERYSVPFFYDGAPDYEIACIPTCLSPGEQPKYKPTTVEGHIMEMYGKTYG